MTTLTELFAQARDTPSDINEHVPELARLAGSVSHVTEFGTRAGVSTTALLYGLRQSFARRPHKLVCYEIVPESVHAVYERLAPVKGHVDLNMLIGDTRQVTIEPTGLLFIDTLHTYAQLTAELERHASQAEYMAFHDTATFGQVGEDGSKPGLLAALGEFLDRSPEWEILSETEKNNGLVVLKRTQIS